MTNHNSHIVLRAEELTIGYSTKKGNTVIANHVNFDLCKGQLIGLVGANGIGKSTLLRTLTKVQPAISGSIYLNEQRINEIDNVELAKMMSIVLTEPIASKNLSVYEVIALGRQPYTNWVGNLSAEDHEVINNAILLTNTDAIKHKKCYELSDGQLQKVMIARALAQETDLIILDEPTTHLDMYHKAFILNLLKQLTRETNKTILFSSHEIDLAIQLCDSMIVMTGDNTTIDEPCNLIAQGVFDDLFPKNLITFDPKIGSFRINNKSNNEY